MRVFALSIGLAFLSSACQERSTTNHKGPLRPCRLPGVAEEVLCGTLRVPENRQLNGGRSIELNIVVLPALERGAREAPLFELAGGPGVAATGMAGFYATGGREYRQRRDVVLVDQRGTGKSNPLTSTTLRSVQDHFREMYPPAYVEDLQGALAAKADLTQYTTPIAMDDLDDVRAWLGYEQINLFGLSYGSRAALVYMRQHPARVRSAILLGVAPTDALVPLHHGRGGKRALDLLFQECANDSECRRAFPQLTREWQEVLTNLRRDPAIVQYKTTAGEETLKILPEIFAEKVRRLMYSSAGRAKVPLLVHRAAAGDFMPFVDAVLARANAEGPDSLADGMYLSVTCAEDVPFIDQAEAARVNDETSFGNYRIEQQTRACSLWPRGEIPADYHQPVRSAAPVLLISGFVDPVTPPEWGEEVARHLPNGRQVVIPALSHSPEGVSNGGCLDEMILRFLQTADAKSLNTSCVERMRAAPFVTGQRAP